MILLVKFNEVGFLVVYVSTVCSLRNSETPNHTTTQVGFWLINQNINLVEVLFTQLYIHGNHVSSGMRNIFHSFRVGPQRPQPSLWRSSEVVYRLQNQVELMVLLVLLHLDDNGCMLLVLVIGWYENTSIKEMQGPITRSKFFKL